jgi:hypothetical protein
VKLFDVERLLMAFEVEGTLQGEKEHDSLKRFQSSLSHPPDKTSLKVINLEWLEGVP